MHVSEFRYKIHFYCLAVETGFYSDAVVLEFCAEGRGFDPQPGQSLFIWIFLLSCYIWWPVWGWQP